jgi:hypothetical protein
MQVDDYPMTLQGWIDLYAKTFSNLLPDHIDPTDPHEISQNFWVYDDVKNTYVAKEDYPVLHVGEVMMIPETDGYFIWRITINDKVIILCDAPNRYIVEDCIGFIVPWEDKWPDTNIKPNMETISAIRKIFRGIKTVTQWVDGTVCKTFLINEL